jgi:1-deoxy-D-xylulose-5-phosphate reductoisomerase
VVRSIALLGATGSIGKSTLDVVARHPDRYRVVALAAQSNWKAMRELCLRFRPRLAALAEPEAARALREALAADAVSTEVREGAGALADCAALAEADTVVAAIVGAAGLASTMAAARAGKRILLANKETLVLAGGLFMQACAASGATVLPVDSEHNAVFQCLPPGYERGLGAVGVRRIVLTASGGPFRERRPEELREVTPEQACNHPNWVMGPKISVDSATMMNKGLEVIEAHFLFNAGIGELEVVVHPQSVVHSLVEFADGSVLAQLGNPDMRTPIAHALAYPERVASGVGPLDLAAVGALTFVRPDFERFRCLGLAYEALRAGGSAPAALNAANEVAVQSFLERRIGFLDIATTCERAMERVGVRPVTSLEDAVAADAEARAAAAAILANLS